MPAASINVPGFGLINYFVSLNQPQLLALLLLVPAGFLLSRQKNTLRLGATPADKLLLAYVLLVGLLQLREANLTSSLRGGYYLVLGTVLPYYVASRAPRQLGDFRVVMLAFVGAAALLGVLAAFETLKHWNLYSSLTHSLGLRWGYGGYLGRDGLLRASGSLGQPLVLGYVMAIGIGFWLFLRSDRPSTAGTEVPLLMMAGGSVAALSRGPWVGAVVILLVFIWTGPRAARHTALLVVLAALGMGALSVTSAGQKALNLLPFIGKVDEFNVTYRQQLLDKALSVIDRHFWLGSVDYLQTPEMQSMIQGEGIVDIVNSYVGVALDHGAIGLALFAGFFVTLAWQLWQAQRRLPPDDETRFLGRALLATLVGIAVMISSLSSVGVIPFVYWLVAGLCVAYLDMLKRLTSNPTPAP
ncbi:O-antigen ligase family protein [Hydrogenophaga atypica]|uniref:O-antigen ligase family protein n=1 Tax=Hydrogenophaga atypica TaxID=249409 RepID=UPI0036D398DE